MDDPIIALEELLGIASTDEGLSALQMSMRAAVVYVVTVVIVRVGKKRFMSAATAFDVILGIMLGSVVSRAITGNAPFVPALLAAATLMAMHWILSAAAVRWDRLGVLIKGRPVPLVRGGVIDWKAMRSSHITERDLWEALRTQGVSRLERVQEATLERSGQVSVVEARPQDGQALDRLT